MDKACKLYRHYDSTGALLYVGVALCPVMRNETHRRQAPWFAEVSSISIENIPTIQAAKLAENAAVLTERPKYNIRLNGRGRIKVATPTETKTGRIAVRITAEAKAALTSAAEEDKRSLSSMVEKIVTDWLRRQASEAKGKGT